MRTGAASARVATNNASARMSGTSRNMAPLCSAAARRFEAAPPSAGAPAEHELGGRPLAQAGDERELKPVERRAEPTAHTVTARSDRTQPSPPQPVHPAIRIMR